jgi:hypothetical protein
VCSGDTARNALFDISMKEGKEKRTHVPYPQPETGNAGGWQPSVVSYSFFLAGVLQCDLP